LENKSHFPSLSNIPSFTSSFLQVNSNGNTFGMSSVLASPISDFNSDYDGEEVHETTQRKIYNNDAHKVPMSVQMNYSMVEYLRQALKNDTNVTQELDRLLGASTTTSVLGEEKEIRTETKKGRVGRQSSFLNRTVNKRGQSGIDVFPLCSEDEDGSVTSSANVSSVGLHVLPPSPISCSGSLCSNEGTESISSSGHTS